MKTGSQGTFVIPWSQTEVDGWQAAPRGAIGVGASWCWRGAPVRLDRSAQVLRLDAPLGEAEMRDRVARKVRRIFAGSLGADAMSPPEDRAVLDEPLVSQGFDVTDGRQVFSATVVDPGGDSAPLVIFFGALPPSGTDLWVVRAELEGVRTRGSREAPGGVICFTPGTRIRTAEGDRPIEEIAEGDLVQTRDNGLQEVVWKGEKRLSGARLFAMPELRPIRFRTGALGVDRPEDDLVVSPSHRMLVRGAKARALFNTEEVLVTARDLVDDRRILRDLTLRSVQYVHLLLPRHEIVFANGLETESFHPTGTALANVEPDERERLLRAIPAVADDPAAYGEHARRLLDRAEAAILGAPGE